MQSLFKISKLRSDVNSIHKLYAWRRVSNGIVNTICVNRLKTHCLQTISLQCHFVSCVYKCNLHCKKKKDIYILHIVAHILVLIDFICFNVSGIYLTLLRLQDAIILFCFIRECEWRRLVRVSRKLKPWLNTRKIHDCCRLSLLPVMAGEEINLTFTTPRSLFFSS